MGSKFGEKLRRARQELRMTQAELGNGKYSTSYVSLLETGSREPTAEIITELSHRLGIQRDVMEAWNTPVSPNEAEFVLLEHRARQSFAAHDHEDARATAHEAAAIAQGMKNSSAWWNMAFLEAESLRELRDAEAFLDMALEVLNHPLTDESPALKVRAETLVSNAYLVIGRLHIAVEHALRATAQAKAALPSTSIIALSAQFALVASLAESGQLDEAWKACLELSHAAEGDIPAQAAGNAHWVIGNVAFRKQNVDEGLRHHELTAELLRPASDIELWTRFNKASAAARMTAGIIEPSTLACIERAEQAQAVIGASPAEELELQIIRSQWEQLNGRPERALELLAPVQAAQEALSIPVLGELELLVARCLQVTGEGKEAVAHLEAAREHFTAAGANDRAALTMELTTQARAALR